MPESMTLFSGGGLADYGMSAAGFTLCAANELDSKIADVYRINHGDHIRVGSILDQDPRTYPAFALLHASPPCPSFSLANNKRGETELDIALAEKTVEFIRILKPQSVTIENVPQYVHSQSYAIIVAALVTLGYWYESKVLNAADFGVPQTRRRLFIRAELGAFVRQLPPAVKWRGWYEAIEDLIPSLPDSAWAQWQMPIVEKAMSKLSSQAFITNGNKGDRGDSVWMAYQPAPTIRKRLDYYRAFVVSGQNTRPDTNNPTLRNSYEPIFTIPKSVNHGMPRAFTDGRIVSMTPRALARLQSVPDSFVLPENKSLACTVIGNGVPSLMYQCVAENTIAATMR